MAEIWGEEPVDALEVGWGGREGGVVAAIRTTSSRSRPESMAALMEGFWIGIGRELDGEALRDRELLLRRPRLLGIEASEAGLMRRLTAPDQAMQAAATMESLSLFFFWIRQRWSRDWGSHRPREELRKSREVGGSDLFYSVGPILIPSLYSHTL